MDDGPCASDRDVWHAVHIDAQQLDVPTRQASRGAAAARRSSADAREKAGSAGGKLCEPSGYGAKHRKCTAIVTCGGADLCSRQAKGVVTNVTAFGAFVDVGVHQDGLVHVSRLSDKFVRDPNEVVKVGDKIRVRVMEVDLARKRIALSARKNDKPGPVAEQSSGKVERGKQERGGQGKRGGAAEVRGDGSKFSNNPFAKLLGKS